VSLSGGDNVIVVRAEDGAGNAVESRFAVTFAAVARNPILGIGLGVVVIAVALIVAFLIARRFLFPPEGSPREPEESLPRADAPEMVAGPARPEVPTLREGDTDTKGDSTEPAEDEFAMPREDGGRAEVDPRVGKLREAFESGKITQDVFEANLRRLEKRR
jgi:hypothetical protein